LLRAWKAAIALLATAIVLGSLLPMPETATPAGLDKLEHFFAYFALALLASGIATPARLRVVMARAFALGAAVEGLQAFVTTTRSADWADLLANALGVLAAWALAGGGRAGWARHVDAWLARRRAS
jgi:VanZ family protein